MEQTSEKYRQDTIGWIDDQLGIVQEIEMHRNSLGL